MPDYVPVACSFHDRLEHLALGGKVCTVTFVEAGREQVAEGRIADIITSRGAEFIVLAGSGDRIRLDRIRDIRPV
jgi:Rho-binding antiterminator